MDDRGKITTKKINKTREEIIEEIAVIARINQKKIVDDIMIREELGVDSIMAIEIIASIEKHYNIELDEAKVFEINTVGEFIDFVESTIKKRDV